MCIGRHLETCNTGPKATPLRLVQSSQPGNAHKLNWQAISSEGSGSMADESLIVSSPFALLPLPLPPPPPLSPAYTYFYTGMHTPVGHSKPQLLLSNLPTKIGILIFLLSLWNVSMHISLHMSMSIPACMVYTHACTHTCAHANSHVKARACPHGYLPTCWCVCRLTSALRTSTTG